MKYYSEVTKALYDSEEACAEAKLKLEQEEKAHAEEDAKANLNAMRENMNILFEDYKSANGEFLKAQKEYRNAISNFASKFGYVPKEHKSESFSWLFTL